MAEFTHIPMFPLAILPLPGELVPLHIFEPRYRQLLSDVESEDVRFGIYFSHEINEDKIGSFMRLESVIKRYPGGESDIIVKCEDVFTMDILMRNFKNRMYPGGDVTLWNTNTSLIPGGELYDAFVEYQRLRNINKHGSIFTMHQIAHELNLDVTDRYRFLLQHDTKKETFLMTRVRYQIHLLRQEDSSKDLYHLN
jgi:hypothetical protein